VDGNDNPERGNERKATVIAPVLAWKKLNPDEFLVTFACGNCGAAATWSGDDVDVADSVPFCCECEQPMALASVCVRK
jgi:hypothetical protein